MRKSADFLIRVKNGLGRLADLNGCHSERRELGKTVCDLHKTSHINILKISSRHIIR